MPCMILTGHPCAGKTSVAEKIRERAMIRSSSTIEKVVLINEATACPDNSIAACYATALAEKKTRAALKSAFDRAVAQSNADTLVILDSSNYIKGFRYELFCISKEAQTSHCVVWCLNDVTTIQEWNMQRRTTCNDNDAVETYSDELLASLIQRYEPPDERNRWDRPLYTIDLRPVSVRSASLAGDVLNQSVYNMHNLSEAIGSLAAEEAPAEKKTASSTFKRAAFKRPTNKPAAPAPSNTTAPDPIIRTGPLTAEALSSFVAAFDDCAATSSSDKSGTAQPKQQQQQQPASPKKEAPQLQSVEDQIDNILDSFLLEVQPLQEGASTRQHVATDSNVLHQVDSITQQVLSAIQSAQEKSTSGATGRLPLSLHGNTLFLEYRRRLPVTELRRIRRQYIQWVGTNPPEDSSEQGIAKSFLAYIETTQ